MNENRNVFGLHGITGMLIATSLLLGILFFLTVLGLDAQKNNADNYYIIKDASSIKMFGSNQADHIVDAK